MFLRKRKSQGALKMFARNLSFENYTDDHATRIGEDENLGIRDVLRKFRELFLEWTKFQDSATSLLPKISLN